MHRSQHHNRNLAAYTVKPGPETGLYYILVANLAHRTTWRELKAFASQACEVDHAEVYPPTSGFVRFLDGNTLEYRALQADGRNLNQDTVVKLLKTDYHAERIDRGEPVRVFSEPDAPAPGPTEPFSQGTGAAMGSPYSDYQGSASPAFNMTDAQWGYVTSPSYVAGGGYQPAPAAPLTPPRSMAYQAVTASSHGFIPQAAIGPSPLVYRAVTSPTPASAQAAVTQYQYADPAAYYSQGAAYDTSGGPGYAGFVQPAGRSSSGHAYVTGYDWPPSEPIRSPPAADQILDDNTSSSSSRPAVIIEQRKILIRDLERDGLSDAVVTNLLVQHAGIGATPGQIERLELPINRDGRARGTAYVTFSAAALANAAVAALDGSKVGAAARKLSARLVVEGVSPDGLDSHSTSGRSSRRLAGGGGGRSGGGGVSSRPDAGRSSRSAQAQSQSQSHGSGSGSEAKVAGAVPQVVTNTASVSASAAGSSQDKKKEERPVIVDGSGGRWKKELAPVVVDGSAGTKGGGGGHRGSRH
ncbi:hypothetical protein C8A01DRAFT_11909 [Parachaetomium inaequale]|uniref:RRM domain-containing protein n=1 Tax=Parachaetomium inaequale TaxID=2588326 RepID=A0AAN6SWG6_9PEZI|nr:hypothetical protein C8A01DRAFT_11909 [Parachaetomium inaequale]